MKLTTIKTPEGTTSLQVLKTMEAHLLKLVSRYDSEEQELLQSLAKELLSIAVEKASDPVMASDALQIAMANTVLLALC